LSGTLPQCKASPKRLERIGVLPFYVWTARVDTNSVRFGLPVLAIDQCACSAASRCTQSQLDGTVITIAGLTADGQGKLYTGVVQSLVHDVKRDPDRRWRVTILDGETQASTPRSA
jgi:hypothetical protein